MALTDLYKVMLAALGSLSQSEASVQAQALSDGAKAEFMAAGYLRLRPNTAVVSWTPAGWAAMAEAKRSLSRGQRRRRRNPIMAWLHELLWHR